MNGLALCAGVGGLELGLHLALGEQYRSVCYCEREAFAASNLVARMEDACLDRAPVWDDIKTFDGRAWRGVVDIITGGYPCQPFSVAGKRLGKADERHLWPDVARIVGEVQPRFCFFENVAGHLRLGYTDVRGDLERLGYRVEAGIFSASEVGASHRRERLFILAVADGKSDEWRGELESGEPEGNRGSGLAGGGGGELGDTAIKSGGSRAIDTDNRQEPTGRPGRQLAHADDGGRRTEGDGGIASNTIGQSGQQLADTKHQPGCAEHGDESGRGQNKGPDHTTEFGASGQRMAFSPERGQRELRESSGGGGQPDGRGAGLADACNGFVPESRGGSETRDGVGPTIPLFPPGPGEIVTWAEVLEIATALEPAVCGVADGLAYRLDRLRCCGNGVVPLVAAKAFVCLAAKLVGRIEA